MNALQLAVGTLAVSAVLALEVLSCKKLDLNFDGTIDVLKYYDPHGAVEIEESDLDFDGQVDVVRGGTNVRHTVGDGTRCVAARCIMSP